MYALYESSQRVLIGLVGMAVVCCAFCGVSSIRNIRYGFLAHLVLGAYVVGDHPDLEDSRHCTSFQGRDRRREPNIVRPPRVVKSVSYRLIIRSCTLTGCPCYCNVLKMPEDPVRLYRLLHKT